MSIVSIREVSESPVEQGKDEKAKYTFDFAVWGISSPTSPVLTVWDVTGDVEQDVTTTVLPTGTASTAGSIITTPLLQSLTPAHLYRMECKVDDTDGQAKEAYCMVLCTV